MDHGTLTMTPDWRRDLPRVTGSVRKRAGLESRALATTCESVVSLLCSEEPPVLSESVFCIKPFPSLELFPGSKDMSGSGLLLWHIQ